MILCASGMKIAADLQRSRERWLCCRLDTHQTDNRPWKRETQRFSGSFFYLHKHLINPRRRFNLSLHTNKQVHNNILRCCMDNSDIRVVRVEKRKQSIYQTKMSARLKDRETQSREECARHKSMTLRRDKRWK